MAVARQEYLDGLTPIEVDPGELLVTKTSGDYEFWLTRKGLKKFSMVEESERGFKECYISAQVLTDEQKPEWACLVSTRLADILFDPNESYRRDLVMKWEKFNDRDGGAFLYVFAPRLWEIYLGKKDYVMTRYDGHTNKVWIRKHPLW